MNTDLSGKVAFITGGSTGIGKATAMAFAQAGGKVAICARSHAELEAAAEEIGQAEAVLTLAADVSSSEQMEHGVAQIIERWKRLDFVLANAGINGVWAPIDELSPDEWDKTVQVNLRGTFLTIRYTVPHLKYQGGAIVITSSVNGTRMFSNSGATAYASTKAAQVALGKMLACELAEHQIRVNMICPGAIDTKIDESTKKRDLQHFEQRVRFPKGAIPLTQGRPGTPAEVADLILFLFSEKASHITGTEIWIDGAQSLLQG